MFWSQRSTTALPATLISTFLYSPEFQEGLSRQTSNDANQQLDRHTQTWLATILPRRGLPRANLVAVHPPPQPGTSTYQERDASNPGTAAKKTVAGPHAIEARRPISIPGGSARVSAESWGEESRHHDPVSSNKVGSFVGIPGVLRL